MTFTKTKLFQMRSNLSIITSSMTDEIYHEVASLEHLLKQPLSARYALFCAPTLRGVYGINCESIKKLGHLGDFIDADTATTSGELHPHPVIIRFYPLK